MHALNNDFNEGWQRFQTSLASYTGAQIRLRFATWSESGTSQAQGMYIDDVGIGEPLPGAPALRRPAMYETATVLRPTLVVWNAIDSQGDPLNYSFEVYADELLQTLVAQVPSIAEGTDYTA